MLIHYQIEQGMFMLSDDYHIVDCFVMGYGKKIDCFNWTRCDFLSAMVFS